MTEQELREQVRQLLLSNSRQGYSKLLKINYCYINPSPGKYPFQFWWDTCFHVFILCALGEYELAKKNMVSLFAVQEEDGFIGHEVSWQRILPTTPRDILQARPKFQHLRPNMSALIEPPMVAQAVLRIYEETHDLAFLSTILPKLEKYFRWLSEHRDLDGDGLITIITPFESGMDWKPSFDPIVGFPHGPGNFSLYLRVVSVDLRNFLHRYNLRAIYKANYCLVKEVGFNTMYAQDLSALARLCSIVPAKEAEDYQARAEKVTRRMVELMYDEETSAFYDVYGHTNTKSKILTPTIFFPLVLPGISEQIARDVIEKHLFNEDEFQSPYPIPSVAMNDPSFSPKETPPFLWRGPTWVMYNWFVYQCLLYRKYRKEADTLLETMKTLIEKSGFREYYDPLSAEGYGEKNFTWSGLVVDMMRVRDEIQKS
jgi:glycogen debranching enzyme